MPPTPQTATPSSARAKATLLRISLALALSACGANSEAPQPTTASASTSMSTLSPSPSTPSPTTPSTTPSLSPTPTPLPTPIPTPSPTSIPTPSPSQTLPVAERAFAYFEATQARESVEGLAAEGSPAFTYAEYLRLSSQAEQSAGYQIEDTSRLVVTDDTTITSSDADFEIVYSDIQLDDQGLVTEFDNAGTPVGDRLWVVPTDVDTGSPLTVRSGVGFSGRYGFFVSLDVTNSDERALEFSDATLSIDGRQVDYDFDASVLPNSTLEPGNTVAISVGSPALADTLGETAQVKVNLYDSDFDDSSATIDLTPLG